MDCLHCRVAIADVDHPPRGCSYLDDGLDRTWEAKLRNLSLGGFFLLFSTFWCSVTSIFATLIASATLRHLGVSVPWLHGKAGAKIRFGTGLPQARMAWMAAALRQDLMGPEDRGLRFAR